MIGPKSNSFGILDRTLKFELIATPEEVAEAMAPGPFVRMTLCGEVFEIEPARWVKIRAAVDGLMAKIE